MKPPNCIAKEFFEIKLSLSVRNAIKRIKQILDASCSKINQNSVVMKLNYFKVKRKDSLLELL